MNVNQELKVDPKRIEVKIRTTNSLTGDKEKMLSALCHGWLSFFNEYYMNHLGFKSIRLMQKKHKDIMLTYLKEPEKFYVLVSDTDKFNELLLGTTIPCFNGATGRKINLDPKRIQKLVAYISDESGDGKISLYDHLTSEKILVISEYNDRLFAPLIEIGSINIFLGTDINEGKTLYYSSFFILNYDDIGVLIDFFGYALECILPEYKQGADYDLLIRMIK